MQPSTKQTLRSIFKTKRQELIKTRGSVITQQLAKQLKICIESLQSQKSAPIRIIGSYFPDIKRQIVPPILEGYQYAYPYFDKKEKGEATPLMEFKLYQNETKNLQSVYGIKVPSKELETVYPQIVMVPLLCFSAESKQRIGYGGGYYDRYISFCRKEKRPTIFIGIGVQELKTQQDFKSDNDECLQYIITESHIY